MKKGSPNPLFTLIYDYFKIYLPNQRKCSSNTIRAYQIAIESLLDFVKMENNISLQKVTFEMINREVLTKFLDQLEKERNWSVSTRNHRLQCIRAFYAYAAEMEITTIVHHEEILKVPIAIEEKTDIIEHMSEAAVKALWEQPDITTRKGIRDQFLMMLLYDSAARIQELLDIRILDLQLGLTPTLVLHGKGSKMRPVTLMEKTVEHLRRYCKVFHEGESDSSSQYLFYIIRSGQKKRMCEDNARRLIKTYGVAAKSVCPDTPENVHPHLLRHSRAMHLYQHGMPLEILSEWLGHAQLETTLIYAHADTELKRKAIESASPPNSPLKDFLNADRFQVDDEDTLKRLYGIRP